MKHLDACLREEEAGSRLARGSGTEVLSMHEVVVPALFRAARRTFPRRHRSDRWRSLVETLLGILGLRSTDERSYLPPSWWRKGRRAVDTGSSWLDRSTGLPLEVTRLADGAPMRLVPAGWLHWSPVTMATLKPKAASGKDPDRPGGDFPSAHMGAFYADRYPVTVRQYARFMAATGHVEPGRWHEQERGLENPVVLINWEDARAYARWCGASLPTDAHWERLAIGDAPRRFPWGNAEPEASLANLVGDWVWDRWKEWLTKGRDWILKISPVQAHQAGQSVFGIEDLAGNVNEWCRDSVPVDQYLRMVAVCRPDGSGRERPPDCRIVRGGSWRVPGCELASKFRIPCHWQVARVTIGFRTVIPLTAGYPLVSMARGGWVGGLLRRISQVLGISDV